MEIWLPLGSSYAPVVLCLSYSDSFLCIVVLLFELLWESCLCVVDERIERKKNW